jgi:hypothetical protein
MSSGGGSSKRNDRRRGRSDFFAAYEANEDAGFIPGYPDSMVGELAG